MNPIAGAIPQPSFPPLLSGRSVAARLDPFEKALAATITDGVEPGAVYFSETDDALRAAIVLAPELPLADAIGVVLAVQLGLADSIGALAPPEVAIHFRWPDRMKVNGALCGRFQVAASTTDPDTEPDWLIVGVNVPVQVTTGAEPGERVDETVLHEEGCADLTVPQIIESWSRHMLVWINRFVSDGIAPLHEAWRGKCDSLGEEITDPEPGLFVGLDEKGGMLLRHEGTSKILPLTVMLDTR
ncbi:MAG: DUF4444 domain-containing protein [Alphaproteobacteria bacterium]